MCSALSMRYGAIEMTIIIIIIIIIASLENTLGKTF